MNLFDKAYQHLGMPAADFSSTEQWQLGEGKIRCVSSLIYDNIESLLPEDWFDLFDKAKALVNAELNKSIDDCKIYCTREGRTVDLKIEVHR